MSATVPPRLSVATARSAVLVERLYAAFEQGDTEAALDSLADDVVWTEPENPWNPTGGTWRGRAGVTKWLAIGRESEEIIELLPMDFLAKGDTVIVTGHMTCRARSTNRVYESDFVHVIQVRDGKIARFQEFFDTWAAAEAFRPQLMSALQDIS